MQHRLAAAGTAACSGMRADVPSAAKRGLYSLSEHQLQEGRCAMRNLTFLALTMLWFAGCGGKEPAAPAAPPRPVVNVPPLTPPPAPPVPVASPVPLAPIAPPPTVLKKAEKGVGDKGRGYGEGMVATPVAAYFAARERIAFDIQVPQALNLFKGEEGRAPGKPGRVHGEDHQGQSDQASHAARGTSLPLRSEDRTANGRAAALNVLLTLRVRLWQRRGPHAEREEYDTVLTEP